MSTTLKQGPHFFFHFENTLREIGPENIRPISTQWYLSSAVATG